MIFKTITIPLFITIFTLSLTSCGDTATVPEKAGIGSQPTLPVPNPTLLPTLHIAPAKGWPEGVTPTAATGLAVNAYATGLAHPRWLCVLPNGDVLVAETNAPPKPEDNKGIKGWGMKLVMKRVGAWRSTARVPYWSPTTLATSSGELPLL